MQIASPSLRKAVVVGQLIAAAWFTSSVSAQGWGNFDPHMYDSEAPNSTRHFSVSILWCRTPISIRVGQRTFLQFKKAGSPAGLDGANLNEPGSFAWSPQTLHVFDPDVVEVYRLSNGRLEDYNASQIEARAIRLNFLKPEILLRPNTIIGIPVDRIEANFGGDDAAGLFGGRFYVATNVGITFIVIPR